MAITPFPPPLTGDPQASTAPMTMGWGCCSCRKNVLVHVADGISEPSYRYSPGDRCHNRACLQVALTYFASAESIGVDQYKRECAVACLRHQLATSAEDTTAVRPYAGFSPSSNGAKNVLSDVLEIKRRQEEEDDALLKRHEDQKKEGVQR